jgi:PEP-CTERM motif
LDRRARGALDQKELDMTYLKSAALAVGFLSFAAMMEPAGAATQVFNWTLFGPAPSLGGVTAPGSGTLTATVSATGGDPVIAITGTIGGNTIAGPISGSFGDNLVFPNTNGTSFLDSQGLSFNDTLGNAYNIFGFFAPGVVTSGNAYGERAPGGFGVGTFTLSAAVPEPSTWAMMLLGFAGLGFAFRQSRRKVSFA